ncbi:alpha/beta hydrolase [Nibrella saemangeumensis]|uniref:Alpha/beta hydrolase n=1 Tax=Nibrella saemangeumensis TaxID=1084526 RepID=A0ABP8N1L2_9BACT
MNLIAVSNTFTLTTSDSLQLAGAYVEPVGEPKGVIALVHGMGEHFGRYTHVAEFFRTIGYATVGMDHRGHGKSQGQRGHTPSFDHLMDDMDRLLKKTHDVFPGLPVVLYGHSMGGNLAANYVLRRNPPLKGLILTDPYFKLAFEPPAWKVAVAKLFAGMMPALSQPTGLEQAAISRDPAVVDAYKQDRLVHDKITSAFFVNVHPAGLYPIEHAGELQVKTLAMHGTADRLTSSEGTIAFARNNPQLIELKLWEGFYHELHNEPDKQQVFDYIAGWLSRL